MSTSLEVTGQAALEAIAERDGFITPNAVVSEATDPTSPLHRYFTWDDSEAAEKYRLEQARGLIRRYHFTVEVEAERTVRIRSFVSLPTEDGGRAYVSTQTAMAGPGRGLIMEQAMRDVASLRAKYQALVDFDEVLRRSLAQRRRARKAS